MKPRNQAIKYGAIVLLASAANANAAATGIAGLIAQVDFTEVTAAIFSIGVIVIGVDLAQIGYMKVRRIIKGAH